MAIPQTANTVANTAVTPAATFNPNQQNPFRQAILQQLQTLQTPVGANSAPIKAQTDAYNLQSQRGLEQTRRALAEQAYASGSLNSGGYQQQQQLAVERAAADRARFVGDTVADAEKARRADLMQALGLGSQFEMQDAQLGQQESQFTRGQAQQESQFGRNLAENARQFDAKVQQDAAQFAAQMGFNYKQLSQQDKQFFENLAWQKEQAKMQDATQRASIGASAGAASARLAFEKERALEDDRRWSLYNTPDVIDAANRAAILKALGQA